MIESQFSRRVLRGVNKELDRIMTKHGLPEEVRPLLVKAVLCGFCKLRETTHNPSPWTERFVINDYLLPMIDILKRCPEIGDLFVACRANADP